MKNKKGQRETEKERERVERERETKGIARILRRQLVDRNSSVEVGYGFSYDIRSKLLIENDMY